MRSRFPRAAELEFPAPVRRLTKQRFGHTASIITPSIQSDETAAAPVDYGLGPAERIEFLEEAFGNPPLTPPRRGSGTG